MSRYAPFEPPSGAGAPVDAPAGSDDLAIRDGFAIVLGPGGCAWVDRAHGPRQDVTEDAHDLTVELFGAPDQSYDSVN
jgi:hypothetical protein